MANLNTFADVIARQNNGQPLVITSPNTLHQSFQIGGSPALLTVTNPMASIDAPEHMAVTAATGKPFRVRAAGLVQGGQKYQIDLALGTGLTPVAASTGLSVGGLQNDNWLLEFEAMWDPASQFIRGVYSGWIGSVSVSRSAFAQNLSGVASLTSLQFNVALTIATANANASFSLTEFAAEYV